MAHWRYYKDKLIPARMCMAEWWCTKRMAHHAYMCTDHRRWIEPPEKPRRPRKDQLPW